MAASAASIADNIFKVIKGQGYNVQLFDTAGANAIEPTEARRFYIKDNNIMITLEDGESPYEVKVNLGKGTEIDQHRGLLDTLRTVASKSLAEYTLRTFGKSLEPKDFAYQAKAAETRVDESISKAYGGKRKSYQTVENARLIITHKKEVAEDKRGARSRNISKLAIDANGERTELPHKNLSAARATLQHIRQGGELSDMIGEHINAMAKEFADLTKFAKYAKTHSLVSEDTTEIYDSVKERMNAIRKTFKQLSGTKGYKAYTETYEGIVYEIDEDQVADLRDTFTRKLFDENVADALPHVAQLVNENSEKKRRSENLHALVNKVTTAKVALRSAPDATIDPDHPDNMNFANALAKAAFMAGYLASLVKDDELANQLGQLADDIHDMPAKEQNVAAKAIMYIQKTGMVAESTQAELEDQMIDDAEMMSRAQFVLRHGDENADVWDSINKHVEDLNEALSAFTAEEHFISK